MMHGQTNIKFYTVKLSYF